MTKTKTVAIGHSDLLAAWAVLENLAVSLDQIGGTYALERNAGNGVAEQGAYYDALAGYFKPALVREIRNARALLGEYISDAEAEKLTEKIPYWNYRTTRARIKRNA